MHPPRGTRPLERVHAAAHGLVSHIDAAQARVVPHLLQYAVIGQLILLYALDHMRGNAVAEDLVQPVKEAAHTHPVRGKLPVAGDDQHLRIRYIRGEQPRCNAPGFDHILPDMVQPAALPHLRVAGHDRDARADQPVDLLAHGDRIRSRDDQPVDTALLQPPDGLEIGAVRAVFQLFHQHVHIIQAAVVHRYADALTHPADEKRVPAGQDHTDPAGAPPRPRRLPLGRRLIAVFVDHFLHTLAHLGRDIRAAVDHPVHRPA